MESEGEIWKVLEIGRERKEKRKMGRGRVPFTKKWVKRKVKVVQKVNINVYPGRGKKFHF
jgi:hypothetical protein